MSYIPLSYLPGICRVNSAYADSVQSGSAGGRVANGRFTDMDKIRFVAGFPEKIGGYSKAVSTAVSGVPRGLRDWRDNQSNTYVGIGTNSKLYYYNQGAFTDITPWRSIKTGTLTNALDTTNTSAVVTVHHTAHGLTTNDYIILSAGSAVGGITPAGVFAVTVSDANTYTITNTSNATSTVSGGGGTISYTYYRIALSNPFDVTSGSKVVTVHHTAHGASTGDYVTIGGSSAVGGITPSGEVVITGTAANTWTFNWTSNASSTVTGGGGSPNFQYDISIGGVNSTTAYGYGAGGYGNGGYGATASVGVSTPARTWSLAHYGQQLLASPYNGTIYIWDPVIQGRAYPLYNAPSQCLFMFVTPERFVFALGTGGKPLQLQWPDQNDYTNWTASAATTANTRTLQEGAYLIGGLAVRDGVNLVFTNTTVYTFNYTGDNYVYDSTAAAVGSGLIGPLAATVMGGVAYWMGPSELWMWNGSVQPLPSDDIRDFVFTDMNTGQSAKFWAGSNVAKKEVWFGYCSAASSEVDRYILYHVDQGCFSCGTLQRTSWVDRGLLSTPMATDASGYLYQQENGVDADGSAMNCYIQFSPMDIAKGDRDMDVFTFIPDFNRQSGNVTLSILAQSYPQDTATTYGPYTIASDDSTPRIDVRVGAKLIGYKLESNVIGGDFRLGLPRIEAQPGGARP